MTFPGARTLIAAVMAALAIGLLAPTAPPPAVWAAEARTKVHMYNLSTPEVRPKRIFTAYNSSPYIDITRWQRWGKKRAVGRGTYVSDCGTCGPVAESFRAKVILQKIKHCTTDEGDRIRVYKRGRLHIYKPGKGWSKHKLYLKCS